MKKYKLSPQTVAHIGRLVSLGIMTGTDISDQMLTIMLQENSSGGLDLTEDYEKVHEEYVQSLVERAEYLAKKVKEAEEKNLLEN